MSDQFNNHLDPATANVLAAAAFARRRELYQRKKASGTATQADDLQFVAEEAAEQRRILAYPNNEATAIHWEANMDYMQDAYAFPAQPQPQFFYQAVPYPAYMAHPQQQLDSFYTGKKYHHTASATMFYALREGLAIVKEEGLEARWERHRVNQLALIAGVEAMGLDLLVKNPADRLPTVTAVMIPGGVDDVKVRNQLLDEFNIEIAGGFGPVRGKIWRVGLMGYCSQKPFVLLFLAALEKCLLDQGFRVPSGAGVGAAIRSYSQVETAAAVSR